MQIGLTWPLQRLLRTAVPYGAPLGRGFCWDAHCITLYGRSSLLLVHCHSRFTCVRFDMRPEDWARLPEVAAEELELGLRDAGIAPAQIKAYIADAGAVEQTRTHGRREVAFLNRAWDDVMAADLLVDRGSRRQPLLNAEVNGRLCRCAGEEGLAAAHDHLHRYFAHRI